MKAKSNFIELNGKRYDARTGTVLATKATQSNNSSGNKAAKKSVVIPSEPVQAHGNIDGISRRTKVRLASKASLNPTHRKAEKSKTLMRSVVNKPVLQILPAAPPTVKKHVPSIHVYPDPSRLSRAKVIPKNPLVSKFGKSQPIVNKLEISDQTVKAPNKPPTIASTSKTIIEAKSISTHQKIMQKALEEAMSHKQPKLKKTTRRQKFSRKFRVSDRAVNLAACSVAVLLLGGFIAYQNVPNLSMRIATARAGVNGTLPSYQPSGFGLAGPIKYKNGQVVLSYVSRSDGRNFKINQTTSQWNSETLLESFVAANQSTYQTFQNNGKTIYVYNDNNATWVDGGVWYQIEGKSALNSDQLLRMAASM